MQVSLARGGVGWLDVWEWENVVFVTINYLLVSGVQLPFLTERSIMTRRILFYVTLVDSVNMLNLISL